MFGAHLKDSYTDGQVRHETQDPAKEAPVHGVSSRLVLPVYVPSAERVIGMSITFDTPAEAFLAVAAVAIAADGVGSMVERKFLFERIKGMDLFQGYAATEFESLMNGITHRVYD